MTSWNWPSLRRIAFWVYVPILFTATHWPRLKMPGPEGSDKVIHVAAFGTWAALLIGAGYFGPSLSRRNILFVLLISPAYAAVDEGLQAIPFVHRSAEFADWYANVAGNTLACIVAAVIMMVRARGTAGPADGNHSP